MATSPQFVGNFQFDKPTKFAGVHKDWKRFSVQFKRWIALLDARCQQMLIVAERNLTTEITRESLMQTVTGPTGEQVIDDDASSAMISRAETIANSIILMCEGEAGSYVCDLDDKVGPEIWRRLTLRYQEHKGKRSHALLLRILTPDWQKGQSSISSLLGRMTSRSTRKT